MTVLFLFAVLRLNQFRRLLLAVACLWAGNGFAYVVWLGTTCTPGSAATSLTTWSNTAAQVLGLNINLAPCHLAPSPTTAQWGTILSAFSHANGSFAPIPRSAMGSDTNLYAVNMTNIISGKFSSAASYGYTLGNLMFYNNATGGVNYSWTTNEVQLMRSYLDSLGHTNVGLFWDDRAFDVGDQAWDNNPLVTGVLLEANTALWFADAGKRIELLHWLWTNPVTANKKIIFQIPDYSGDPTGKTNTYMADRLLLQWLGTQIMDFNFMRSTNVVFMPVTYGAMWFNPEMAAPNNYTNNMTSIALSLIEQTNLFEGITSIPTVADALSTFRNMPPVIGAIPNQTVPQGSLTATIPFTVSDQQTPAASLIVNGSAANGSLVTGLSLGGGGSTRTVTATLNPTLTGSSIIALTASDGVITTTNTFLLTVGPVSFNTAVTNGHINLTNTWGGPVPAVGDTNTWQSGSWKLTMTNTASQTFYGQTLVIQTNGELAPGIAGATLTLNNLVLNGGLIDMQNNSGFTVNLSGKTFTLNSGTLQAGGLNNSRDVNFQNGSLAGSGTIDITGTDATGSDVEFQSTINTSGFSGVFSVHDYGILNLSPITNATFGLNLSGTGKYWNDTNVALTSLIINGTVLTNGTYTYASFNSNPTLQAFLGNNGGTITVSSNTPPTLTGLTSVNVNEDSTVTVTYTVGDADTAASSLVVSAYSTNQTLLPIQNLFPGGSGANRTLSITPGLNQSGTNTIFVSVSDGWFSTTRPLVVNVLFSNYPPTISSVPNQVVNSNTPTVAIFTVGDLESDPGQLAVTATSSNPSLVANTNLLLGGSSANRSVKIMPTAGQMGTTTIKLVVSDGVQTATNSFQIKVVPMNVINAVVSGALDTNTTWSSGVLPVAGDTNTWQSGGFDLSLLNKVDTFYGNTLSIQAGDQFAPGVSTVTLSLNKLVLGGGTIYMGNNAALTIDLSGQPLTLNSGTLKAGGATSTRNVVFQDGSLLGGGAISITGTDTNGSDVEFLDSMSTRWFTGTFNVSNNGMLSLPYISPQDASFGLNISGTGTYELNEDTAVTSLVINGVSIPPGAYYSFSDFSANAQNYLVDNGGTLTVISTNNTAPTLAALANQTLIAGQTLTLTNVAADNDVPAQTLTFSLLSAPGGGVINASNGVFRWRPAIAQSPSTNLISVVVTDSGSPPLSATNQFSVTVIQPARPVVSLVGFNNGVFSFVVNGTNGPDYVVLTSTNLTTWSPLWTNSSPVLPFNFTNATTNFSQLFYQVLLGP